MRWSWWLGDPLLSAPMANGGRVFAVFPASEESDDPEMEQAPKEDPQSAGDSAPSKPTVRATHMVGCFDADSGKVLWRRRIGSDGMSSPVAAGSDVFLAALDGTLYQFGQSGGELRSASAMRATSAPVIVDGSLFMTRRADAPDDKSVAECIARHDASSHELGYVAAARPAPYLDQKIQRETPFVQSVAPFENANGIGGGFGGGFKNVPPERVGELESGSPAEAIPPPNVPMQNPPTAQVPGAEQAPSDPVDALAATELQAAANIGLGNVSTIQVFQGSRLLYDNGRLVNCMGDAVVCVAADTGRTLWSTKLDGELEKTGGHLATAPVAAGGFIFVATVGGKILQIDREHGAVAKTYDIGSPLRSPPAIDGGRIYVGTQDGKVVCIDTGDRALTGWPMLGGDPGRRNIAAQK
jgi:hypothetical protein